MGWIQQSNIRGPQGIQGIQGIQGVPGADGTGIEIAGQVATYGDLPTGLTAADSGKGYLVQADGLLYIWSGTAFPANGSGTQFKGPKGDTGATGAGFTGGSYNGANGLVTFASNDGLGFTTGDLRGAAGAKGDPGDQGTPGTAGANGTKWYTGSGVPGTVTGAVAGDLYLDTSTGDVYTLA